MHALVSGLFDLFPRRRALLALSLLGTLMLSGCANNQSRPPEPPPPDLSQLAHEAAAQMMAGNPALTRYSPMIAATFVSIDNLTTSSTFGRISSEIMASALAQQGMQVREVKMRDSMFIEENVGELILSRQVQRLSSQNNARSILMGTYAQGQDYIYVSTRVVRAGDAMVLATADFKLAIDNNVLSLLEGQGGW
ncbi:MULTISPECIES: FlgO family outer membrane protein [unclassified Halomonas]|uniref:FlgO family outer membrane protein n=1 Tax=unclassified Halomonas TaxID=2609666 RepID=UPI0020A17020|nr:MULTISPECIES: FlgO family outer membrane protein [unclassified Halomonas]MCP1314303.1 FlgO family outer membrane protein [Halomonas sp. 707D7]MCP1328169.1 FlgO family outer membrane protein [Halomonas sp. 707D4]